MVVRISLLSIVLALALVSCANKDVSFDGRLIDLGSVEGGVVCTVNDLEGDADSDGISNSVEDCLNPNADADHDGIRNWQSWDSDADRIPDKIEAGPKDGSGQCADATKNKAWPCDHDGDGVPDYIDLDSDNDKLLDKDEDPNGDGQVGCCITKCGQVDPTWQKENCTVELGTLTEDGCGQGQKCENGLCTPSLAFTCSQGETSRILKDTFGDGTLDPDRGTWICRDATEDKPHGRKEAQVQKSTGGDWTVAVEKLAKYSELALPTPAAKEAAGTIDNDDKDTEAAGFVISKSTDEADVQISLQNVIKALQARIPAGPGKISIRSTGTQVKSHDRYDSVQGTILDLTLSASSNVSNVRNELIGAILGRQMANLGNLPGAYGSSGTDFVIRLVTVRRFAFKKENGNEVLDTTKACSGGPCPVDDGDKSNWRLMFMGAVGLRGNYQDPQKRTGFVVDDLSNGTGMAIASDGLTDACNVAVISQLPVADIIWVMDESGSMDDKRKNVVANANNFFNRALASGLDFRMCVTDVCDPDGYSGCTKEVIGKCCSKDSSDGCDNGGTDRFLLPSEGSLFSACVDNPPGCEYGSEYGLTNIKEAVTKHLPRADGAVDKVRPEAKLVVVIATDEAPEEYKDAGIVSEGDNTCQLDSAKKASSDAFIKPYLDLLSGATDPEAASMFHMIGGICNNSCGANTGYGYSDLAQALGGQVGDVCQTDLGNTLQVIIDSIIGAASPVKLQYVPISSTLAVALDGTEVPRSRTAGFDYRSSSNSVAFINMKYKKGSQVITSYHRWKKQIIPQ
jgi:hypothetical protein